MGVVRESYTPVPVDVNATVTLGGNCLGGFLAKTGGTVTVVNGLGVTILSAFPVTAGVYYPMPFNVGEGATFTTAGGAGGLIGN